MSNRPFRADLQVRHLSPDEVAEWPYFLSMLGTYTILDAWTGLSQVIYGYPVHRLEVRHDGGVGGILALVEVRHPLFGRYLTTSPFGSYGGIAFDSPDGRNALLAGAESLRRRLDADHVNVRFALRDGERPPAGWVENPIYATFVAELSADPDELMATYSSDHRNHIRKSLRKGFSARFGHLELLDEAYEGLARSMHELGSPYHGKAYLRAMAERLGDALELAVLLSPDGEVAGAGVFIVHGETVTNLHANILRTHRSAHAGELLYWKAIERYGERGLQAFDLGRSLLGSGNEAFKMKWRPRRQFLAYWYSLKPGRHVPGLHQANSRLGAAVWMWKRLPPFVVRRLGPFLIRGLA